MGLLSIFKRRDDPRSTDAAAASPPADAVQQARTRARQRLIGAVVLVGIGIVGFPLVFETQPRSIPVDIPVEMPRKDNAPPLVMPAARTPNSSAAVASQPVAEPPVAKSEVITESRADAGLDVAASAAAPVARAASKSAATVPAKPAETPAAKPAAEPKPPAPVADAARAKALLDGKPAASRFVVQVGAFADANAARETRVKVEKLGMKTYTQVASTSAGDRIRVRVGPFASRDEADKALAKARAAGLAAVVLTL